MEVRQGGATAASIIEACPQLVQFGTPQPGSPQAGSHGGAQVASYVGAQVGSQAGSEQPLEQESPPQQPRPPRSVANSPRPLARQRSHGKLILQPEPPPQGPVKLPQLSQGSQRGGSSA